MLTHSDPYLGDSPQVVGHTRHRHGHPTNLETLFHRYHKRVYWHCLYFLKHPREAEDAMMDIFEQLPKYLSKYEIRCFSSWLYTFCRNHCLTRIAKSIRDKKCRSDWATYTSQLDQSTHLKWELERKFEKLDLGLERLNSKQRNCIIYFYFERQSYKAIAKQMGISNKEVKTHIQNGRRNLRRFILQSKV